MSSVLPAHLITAARPNGLTGRDSVALDARGRVDLGHGAALIRPTLDRVAAPPPAPREGHFATAAELAAVAAVALPLAEHEQAIRDAEEALRQQRGCRADTRIEQAQLDALQADHPPLRGAARLALLDTLDSATRRAAQKHKVACDLVADAAAELEALGTLRDELIGGSTFDPNGAWGRQALLAPSLVALRPRGWSITSDAWGRDCYWTAASPTHRDAVRKAQLAFRAEVDTALATARWPF